MVQSFSENLISVKEPFQYIPIHSNTFQYILRIPRIPKNPAHLDQSFHCLSTFFLSTLMILDRISNKYSKTMSF